MTLPSTRWTVAFGVFAVGVILAAASLAAEPEPGEGPPTPLPAADQQIQEVADAFERFKKYDFDGAMAKLKEATTKRPELPPAQVIMFSWFARLNQPTAARASLERAVNEVPDDPQAYLILGDLALRESRVTEAALLYAKASTLMPGLTNAERKKGLAPAVEGGLAAVAEARRDWDTAKKHLEAWLKLDPESATAMQRLARAMFQLKDSKGALEQLKAAKAANADVLSPAAQLARFYQQAEDQKNAKIWMDYAQQSAPDDLATQLVVAQWCLETGDLERAEKQANAAMRLDRESLEAKILRGVIALFKKDYATGATYFESALLASPGYFPAKNNLALALCELEDDAKKRRALAYAEENARLYPKNAEAASTYAWVLYKSGRVRDADRVLTGLARSGRVSEDTAYFIAQVAAELGRKEEAITVLQSALKSKRPFSKRDEAEALLRELQR